jgi:hypothetical protein
LILGQNELYTFIASGGPSKKIKIEIALESYGSISEPHVAYYGTVSASDIAAWWQDHGRNLLFRNIRDFKGPTDVNDGMRDTLSSEPANFWYFNNGITLLCSRIRKKPFGGSSNVQGIFECEDVSIVNGAQTVGLIGSYLNSGIMNADAKVQVRLISLENAPQGFDSRITRATNTQNRIEGHDFASLDLTQRRLASELLLDGIHYAVRTGEPTPDNSAGFTLLDATVAQACAQEDSSLAVQVKNQIGRIFDTLLAPPYTILFNDQTDARELWRRVRVMRTVDECLKRLESDYRERSELVAVHANRFILHRVFQVPQVKDLAKSNIHRNEQLEAAVQQATADVFGELIQYLNNEHIDAYLAPLFKNRQKCREIAIALERKATTIAEAKPMNSLFDDVRDDATRKQ